MLDLLNWRRTVTDLYRDVRANSDYVSANAAFRLAKDHLFQRHPQSALDDAQKATFKGLRYYDYDPAYRVMAKVDNDVEPVAFDVEVGNDGNFRYTRFGKVNFTLPTGTGALNLYWINGYGGGLFLPFGDMTNRETTYGAGRYLYDTIKGADIGATLDELVLDFNYAYNPSCAYNPRWVCPLAPRENRLPFPVPVGEMVLDG